MKTKLFYLSCLFILTTSVAQANNFLPASYKNLQPVPSDSSSPGQGFIDPYLFSNPKPYTLACKCAFNPSKSQWEATDPTCLFANECALCGGKDKTCEVRYPDYGSNDIYVKTFYADRPNDVTTKKCTVVNPAKMICKPGPNGSTECNLDPNFKPIINCETVQ